MGKLNEIKKVYQELYVTMRDFPEDPNPYQKGDLGRDFLDNLKSTPAVLRRSAGEIASTVGRVYDSWYEDANRRAELKKWREELLLNPGFDFINLVEALKAVVIEPYYWGCESFKDLGIVQYYFRFSAWHYNLRDLSDAEKLKRLEDVICRFYCMDKEVPVKLQHCDFLVEVIPRFQQEQPRIILSLGMNGIGREQICKIRRKNR